MTNDLIEIVRARASKPKKIHDMARSMSPAPSIYPPATLKQITATEASLGFSLPPLFKQFLTEIGNGGFGPGYGLLGAQGGHGDFDKRSMAEVYWQAQSKGANEDSCLLPEKILPVCNWGCGIYSCLDCREAEAPVYFYNPDLHVLSDKDLEATFMDAGGVVIWTYKPAKTDAPSGSKNEEEPPSTSLILHKRSFGEWMSDWGKGVKLWDEMEDLLASI